MKRPGSLGSQGSEQFPADAAWSPARIACARVLYSTAAEVAIGTLICLSFLLVIIEADNIDDPPQWTKIANIALLILYSAEVSARIFVVRSKFFWQTLNILDLVLIATDTISEVLEAASFDALPSLVVLRIFRLLRLTRTFKVMVMFPQLALMVKGLVNALSAIMYGVTLLCVVLLFWSVCAVHFIHPVNQRVSLSGKYSGCDRCEHAFEGVFQSMLTFVQQILAGDSWGLVTIPIIEEAPWTALFFALVFISIHLTITNVILAVIVDSALKASQDDIQEVLRAKADEFHAASRRLSGICKEMDTDGSGDLTADELVAGFDTNPEFHDVLMSMDVVKEDLEVVFSILDADESGTVPYDEFVTELFKMRTRDSHTLLVFIKHYVTEIRKDVREQIRVLKGEVLARIDENEVANRTSSPGDDSCGLPCAVPACAPLEEKEKIPSTMDSAQEGSTKYLWGELRDLRNVITEHLVASMHEISQKSESHARLLATIAGDTSLLRGNDSPLMCNMQLALPEAGAGGPGAFAGHRPPSMHSSIAACDPVLLRARQPEGVSLAAGPPAPSPLQPAPSSAWSMQRCCGAQRTAVVSISDYAAPNATAQKRP